MIRSSHTHLLVNSAVVVGLITLALVSCGQDTPAQDQLAKTVPPDSTDLQDGGGTTVKLQGTVEDDTLPPGGSLVIEWTKVSGPGPVDFNDPSQLDTTATFYVAGEYVLRLTTSDGEFAVSDDVAITVNLGSESPAT